jgi:hypothetical protein
VFDKAPDLDFRVERNLFEMPRPRWMQMGSRDARPPYTKSMVVDQGAGTGETGL